MKRIIAISALILAPVISFAQTSQVEIVGVTAPVPVQIDGTPNVTATIQGTPNVSISGIPNVSISGIPTINANIQGVPDVNVSNAISVNSLPDFATVSDTVNDHSTNALLVWCTCGLLFGIGFIGGNKV